MNIETKSKFIEECVDCPFKSLETEIGEYLNGNIIITLSCYYYKPCKRIKDRKEQEYKNDIERGKDTRRD